MGRADLKLDDDIVNIFKSGKINNRLLCEIINILISGTL